ncbi:GH92 family glycosyl hydrolase [Gilvibacter sp.]|uniref:GH92 family glycosyl hydrolase n=1 Tax=Gilvibacter sp. TaxID=2729997 RepID=UPI003F4A6965
MYRSLLGYFLLAFIVGCSPQGPAPAKQAKKLISYVNPFIGTGGHGHTYPGATLPFGMMQLSPDTRLDGWDGCSGYHYSDDYIYGFSHTHLSGTGVSDYGDLLLSPTNSLNFNNGANGLAGYGSKFSHENEIATPGFYQVRLDDTKVTVSLTTSERAGMHKYEFDKGVRQFIVIDLDHRDKLLEFDMEQTSTTEFSGYRFSEAWATDQRLFFYIKFSKPVKQSTFLRNGLKKRKAALEFDKNDEEPLYVTVGISAVDEEGAKANAEAEVGELTFDQLRARAEEKWEAQLQKIVVENQNEEALFNFYTSIYHSMLAPNLYQDVDGRYRGMDLEVHQADFNYYTVFSLWDTYRAAHPLYTIIEQERTNDFVKTMLAKYQEGGIIPIWDLSANYTGCMIGYHGIPVIADAYMKGLRDYDTDLALEAMKHSATRDHLGLEGYKEFGYVPMEQESESVSKTLEYAYDDWTIAQMAQEMGEREDYNNYIRRAQNYKNVFNPETGFMQGRFRNQWFTPFDPYEVNFNYTEANAWQYSLYVPQDINGLIDLMGGPQAFEAHLDQLFTAKTETSGRDQADITGLIGQYAHGNEPSHHMAYLYNFVGKPEKTQKYVQQIGTTLYTNTPDGISGNEDCGQMSAWYVFSALGFYPVTPASNQYIIGTPLMEKATINLESGKSFTVIANNFSHDSPYIQAVRLNGKPLERSYLWHEELTDGGWIEFDMGPQPGTWGTADEQLPTARIEDQLVVTPPFISAGDIAFKNQTEVSLQNINADAVIFYRLNEADFAEYSTPFTVSEDVVLETYANLNGQESPVLRTPFYKVDPSRSIKLESEFANQYNAGGNDALIDGIRGSEDFRTGAWQGYQDQDVIAIVDLGSVKAIDSIKVGFLQDQGSWIFLPTQVECYVSDNPNSFNKNLPPVKFDSATRDDDSEIAPAAFSMNGYSARYVKIVAKNLGDLPAWHLGAPYNGKAWIFVDEIVIE